MLEHKQSELDTGRGSCTVVLLVSPLVSLMIAKSICLGECCFVVRSFFQLCTYATFKYLVFVLFHVDKLHERYSFTEL